MVLYHAVLFCFFASRVREIFSTLNLKTSSPGLICPKMCLTMVHLVHRTMEIVGGRITYRLTILPNIDELSYRRNFVFYMLHRCKNTRNYATTRGASRKGRQFKRGPEYEEDWKYTK